VTGTTFSNALASETITGSNASSVYTVLDYLKVTSITTSGSTASSVTVGTNGISGSMWVRFDPWAYPNVSIQCVVSGTVNYTVQQTLDDPNSPAYPILPYAVTWVNSNDPVVVGATATQQSNYLFTPVFSRVVLNSGTGSVAATFSQNGVNSA
jgi:hypothetical protein